MADDEDDFEVPPSPPVEENNDGLFQTLSYNLIIEFFYRRCR